MAIIIDPVLRSMPERVQRDLQDELASGRRGLMSASVLPLNDALILRQQRIDGLEATVAALRKEVARLEPIAKQRTDWEKAIANAQATLPPGYVIAVVWMCGDCNFWLRAPDGQILPIDDFETDAEWINKCTAAAIAHHAANPAQVQ